MNTRPNKLIVLNWLVIIALAWTEIIAGQGFDSWPEGGSPREVGTRVAERFVATPMPAKIMFNGVLMPHAHIGYWETCAWYGALAVARETRNEALVRQLQTRFDLLLGPRAELMPEVAHEHSSPFGAVPLELYLQTHDPRYLKTGVRLADSQWTAPVGNVGVVARADIREVLTQAAQEGLSAQPRYWISDEAYLFTIAQVQAFRATGRDQYINRAAEEMVAYINRLQQPNGLFYHKGMAEPFGTIAPFFWGRGNGWAAAAMSEILRSLPEDHPARSRILASYRAMMAALLKFQGDDGLWRQLIDDPEAWPESSCTGMFTFALVTGVKQGWLDAKIYSPAARKGWLGLAGYIDEKGEVREVCEGTWISADRQYYLDRTRYTGDLHGQAAVLWSAAALLR
jgi:unsaturated rhamnogalacturonyl hydrolase